MTDQKLSEHARVKLTIHIRKNDTGEIRIVSDFLAYLNDEGNPETYIWEEGNYACDCNRHIFFKEARHDTEDLHHKCSETEYAVKIFDANNKCIYDEIDNAQ